MTESVESPRIMVVDDEVIVADDIKHRLIKLGYRVVGVASTGEGAIMLASGSRPDLILMDIMLKGDMDGVEAAEEIGRRFDIPVIFLTAYSDEDTLSRAKITGPFGYILKPFDERDLQRTIDIALYHHRVERELKEAKENIKVLSGLLPICATCKQVRDDKGYWSEIEVYIREHSEADFTHGICPKCKEAFLAEAGIKDEG